MAHLPEQVQPEHDTLPPAASYLTCRPGTDPTLASQLHADFTWLLADPVARLADITTLREHSATQVEQPAIARLIYNRCYEFDEPTEDAIFADPEVVTLVNYSRKSGATHLQLERTMQTLRLRRLEIVLERSLRLPRRLGAQALATTADQGAVQ